MKTTPCFPQIKISTPAQCKGVIEPPRRKSPNPFLFTHHPSHNDAHASSQLAKPNRCVHNPGKAPPRFIPPNLPSGALSCTVQIDKSLRLLLPSHASPSRHNPDPRTAGASLPSVRAAHSPTILNTLPYYTLVYWGKDKFSSCCWIFGLGDVRRSRRGRSSGRWVGGLFVGSTSSCPEV